MTDGRRVDEPEEGSGKRMHRSLGERSPGPAIGSEDYGPEAARQELLEALMEQAGDDPRLDLIRMLTRLSSDPTRVLGPIIDAMSQQELMTSISSFSDISPEKLKESPDPKAFARRLAELAMEGLIQVPAGQGPDLQNVTFSEDGPSGSDEHVQFTSFAGDGRILATFPMGEYEKTEVFVKWTRVDDPKIMLFNHYPIKPDADFNYVWLRPKDGWESGEYRVDFYTADDALTPIAGGWYLVDAAQTPP